jgi:hypothetical protein
MTADWHTEYARALDLFGGDTPSATLEQQLVDQYAQHPQAVSNAITKIGKAYAAGKIHSPWGALRAEIPKQIALRANPPAPKPIDDLPERTAPPPEFLAMLDRLGVRL